jgi:RimJ/RimL family protein N-acetyltransferase
MDNFLYYIVDKGTPEFNNLIRNPITKKSLFDILKPDFPEEHLTNLDELLTFDNHIVRFSMCIHEDRVISNAIGGPPYTGDRNVYYISLVRTIEAYQGRGLCKNIIYNLVDSYWDYTNNRVKNNFKIRLEVLENNVGAIACYKKIGFDRIHGLYERRQDLILIIWMQLDIIKYINYSININLLKLVIEVNKYNNDHQENTLINTIREKIIKLIL